MKAKLEGVIGWRGVSYSGECEIPDDLAIALGLLPAQQPSKSEGKSATPADRVADLEETKEEETEQEEETEPAPKPTAKRRKGDV